MWHDSDRMIALPHTVSNISHTGRPTRYAAPRFSLSVPNMGPGAKSVQKLQGPHEKPTHAGAPSPVWWTESRGRAPARRSPGNQIHTSISGPSRVLS